MRKDIMERMKYIKKEGLKPNARTKVCPIFKKINNGCWVYTIRVI